jgi:hypothetical protein
MGIIDEITELEQERVTRKKKLDEILERFTKEEQAELNSVLADPKFYSSTIEQFFRNRKFEISEKTIQRYRKEKFNI